MAASANLLAVGGVPVDRDVVGARDRGLERLHEVTERELRVAACGARRDELGSEAGVGGADELAEGDASNAFPIR